MKMLSHLCDTCHIIQCANCCSFRMLAFTFLIIMLIKFVHFFPTAIASDFLGFSSAQLLFWHFYQMRIFTILPKLKLNVKSLTKNFFEAFAFISLSLSLPPSPYWCDFFSLHSVHSFSHIYVDDTGNSVENFTVVVGVVVITVIIIVKATLFINADGMSKIICVSSATWCCCCCCSLNVF